MIKVEIRCEALTRTIVEIILWIETEICTILLTQILHTFRLADRVILTCHMIGYKVDNHLHTSLVRTVDQLLKLLHTFVYVDSQVRIHIVIVGNGVWRTGLTLDDGRMVPGYSECSIVCLRGMTNDAGIPDVADTHLPDFLQGGRSKVGHLSTAVLLYRSILFARRVTIAVEPGEYLIYDNLTRCHEQRPLC